MHSKVGCSTWKKNLLLLSSLSEDDKAALAKGSLHGDTLRPRLVLPNQEREGFNVVAFANELSLLKFVFVRHPYERLISCYEDKILRRKSTYAFYNQMLRLYNDTSFSAFVNYVLMKAVEANCCARSAECRLDNHIRHGRSETVQILHPSCVFLKADIDGRVASSPTITAQTFKNSLNLHKI